MVEENKSGRGLTWIRAGKWWGRTECQIWTICATRDDQGLLYTLWRLGDWHAFKYTPVLYDRDVEKLKHYAEDNNAKPLSEILQDRAPGAAHR